MLALMIAASLLATLVARSFHISVSDGQGAGLTNFLEVERRVDLDDYRHCRKKVCGLSSSYVELSCSPERDGPVLYVKLPERTLVMACGGACMTGWGPPGSKRCEACPPPEWNACTSSIVEGE